LFSLPGGDGREQVLSELWQPYFHGDSGVIGRAVTVGEHFALETKADEIAADARVPQFYRKEVGLGQFSGDGGAAA
jgi:hypothetical protein